MNKLIEDHELEYIAFVLIGDNFDISHILREQCCYYGMDGMFEICHSIAQAFVWYDVYMENYEIMSTYASLTEFLNNCDDAIKSFINNPEIDLIEIIRSNYEQN